MVVVVVCVMVVVVKVLAMSVVLVLVWRTTGAEIGFMSLKIVGMPKATKEMCVAFVIAVGDIASNLVAATEAVMPVGQVAA